MLKRSCHLKFTLHPLIEGFPVCHLMWVNMGGNGWSEGVKCWLGCAYWCANEQWMIIFIHFPCLDDEQSVATRWVDLLFSTRLVPNAESLDNSIFTAEVSWWMERGEVELRSLMEKNGQKDGSPTPHPEVEELEIYSPERLAWNLQINTNHPFRKANDLNQTSMRTCFHVNFQGCTEKMMVGSPMLSLKVRLLSQANKGIWPKFLWGFLSVSIDIYIYIY